MQAEYATADADLEDPPALGDLEPLDDPPPLLHAAASSATVANSAATTPARRVFISRFVLMPVSLRFAQA